MLKTAFIICICLCAFVSCAKNAGQLRSGETSGKFGDNLFWAYDPITNVLSLNGTGPTDTFNDETEVPWYQYGDSIKEVVFEEGITSFGNYMFQDCTKITSLNLPLSVSTIGYSAFVNCKSLRNVTYSANVRSMFEYDNPFIGCENLIGIYVDKGNKRWEDVDGVLFKKEKTLLLVYPPGKKTGSFVIPNATQTIESSAFSGSRYLTSVTIPDGLKTIGHYAFESSGLTHVWIPASVQYIGSRPFGSCTSLLSIEVDSNNLNYTSKDGVLFKKGDSRVLVQYPCGKKGSYTIPSNITIATDAFFGSAGLTSITIPARVNAIGFQVFYHCSNLEIVRYLGTDDLSLSFVGCEKLRIVCVPLEYTSSKFSGITVCKRESCDKLEDVENQCFYAVCKNDEWGSVKREEAEEWENKTNGCVDFTCDNTSGLLSVSKCTSQKICVDDKCVDNETSHEKGYVVSVPIDGDEMPYSDPDDVTETVCNLFDCEKVEVGVELDADGHIINLYFYVDDLETALELAETVDNLEKGKDCQYGLLCFSKKARVKELNGWESAGAHFSEMVIKYICFVALMLLVTS